MFGVLIITLLAIYIAVGWFCIKRLAIGKARYLALIVLILLPFLDEIVGRIYFGYTCATQVDSKVYQIVELAAEHWDSFGNPKFLENNSYKLSAYPTQYNKGTYSSIFHIDYLTLSIINKQTGDVHGEVTEFMYWHGWIGRYLSPNNTAIFCDGQSSRFINLV